jgi:hypothetical protein
MKKVILFITLSFTIVLCSCNRWQHEYPEDGGRTKVTPVERITNKWWELKSVIAKIGDFRIYFRPEGEENGLGVMVRYATAKSGIETQVPAVWGFSVNTDIISISRVNVIPPVIAPVPCYVAWDDSKDYEILKLTNSEFKITETFNSITKTWLFASQ